VSPAEALPLSSSEGGGGGLGGNANDKRQQRQLVLLILLWKLTLITSSTLSRLVLQVWPGETPISYDNKNSLFFCSYSSSTLSCLVVQVWPGETSIPNDNRNRLLFLSYSSSILWCLVVQVWPGVPLFRLWGVSGSQHSLHQVYTIFKLTEAKSKVPDWGIKSTLA
jgi:hypothetical protein